MKENEVKIFLPVPGKGSKRIGTVRKSPTGDEWTSCFRGEEKPTKTGSYGACIRHLLS